VKKKPVDALSQHRLKWKCRRGLLELDLVLQDFVEKKMHDRDVDLLNELLELEDNDLWDIVSGRSDRFDARHGGIVARLRAV
jgi:antitoxin CptB